jgi:hypothetical protein
MIGVRYPGVEHSRLKSPADVRELSISISELFSFLFHFCPTAALFKSFHTLLIVFFIDPRSVFPRISSF